MALRSGHGAGKGTPHIEVLPIDELPAAVPAEPVRVARHPDGRFVDSDAAKAIGRLGGLAKANSVRLVTSLGLSKLAEDSAFRPYRNGAEEFHKHHVETLAYQAGGIVGPAPNTMVASAALQLAGSRFCFDKFAETIDMAWLKQGSQLANDSRQNLLAAYELAVKEANARAAVKGPQNPFAGFLADETDKEPPK